jgi:hypothetical protein
MAPMDEDDDVGGSVGLLNAKTVGEDEVEAWDYSAGTCLYIFHIYVSVLSTIFDI